MRPVRRYGIPTTKTETFRSTKFRRHDGFEKKTSDPQNNGESDTLTPATESMPDSGSGADTEPVVIPVTEPPVTDPPVTEPAGDEDFPPADEPDKETSVPDSVLPEEPSAGVTDETVADFTDAESETSGTNQNDSPETNERE